MPISVKCSDCGKPLKAPDNLAGKKAKCPDCGAVVTVPVAAEESDANDDRQTMLLSDGERDEAEIPMEDVTTRKPCPMCGELIATAAARCRFCGETLKSTVRNRERQRTHSIASNQLTGTDIALCVCFPIGCIVGIIALITGQPSKGIKMVALAVLMPFLWLAIASIFR